MRCSLLIISLFLTTAAWTEECSRITTGTWSGPQNTFPAVPPYLDCPNCREMNAFTQDFINHAWNVAVHGNDTYTANGDPLAVYFSYMDRQIYDPSIDATTRVCNRHGQCVSVTITVNHNHIGVVVGSVNLTRNTTMKNITIRASRANGTGLFRTFLPALMDANPFRVPYNNTRDPHPTQECLNNFTEVVVPFWELRTENMIELGNDPELYEKYERYHDEEKAYGGRVPHLDCGATTAEGPYGAFPNRTCLWVW